MYKYLITAIIVAIFAGCSAPKPTHAPVWYTSPPKDFNFFYSVASGKNIKHAKNKAILNLRKQIQSDIDSVFINKTTKLKIDDETYIQSILSENERLVNTMSLISLKIEKTGSFNGENLILLKLPRKSIFDKLDLIASKRLKDSKEDYSLLEKETITIKKYAILNKEMKKFSKLASIIEAKRVVLNNNNIKEVNYLNTLYQYHLKLKNKISIYVLSDMNSRIYTKSIKDALSETGLNLSNKKGDDALKLFITSTTENMQDYGFKKSKSLVKYSLYDSKKQRLAFRQHTFEAKSRKGYSDAKAQSAVHEKSKIKKLGIFNFLGIK